ncbi:unnamed protein product [Heligmosomoides polygyrus]|uniref:Peroxin/Ferlin domain-containing protein n=1 Tax=Heligmosomoides polygyrus TaxID=6339 RepID=A0A3P8AAI5_HELPZ|nr:unnamed protein product [Heligmosomoides polygyrus]
MGTGYLWLVNAKGVPYRVTAESKIEHISDAQWKPEPLVANGEQLKVRQIAAASHAAFALDHSGSVFQFVLNSHLTIRRRVEIYANQRWYPMIGWSSWTLPTDRASFSNEDGSRSGDLTGFQLKADGWRWEEPWIVDGDVRRYDREGWEYATNFAGTVWSPEGGVGSFVRRRKWKRHMRYTSIEKWAELPREDDVFVDLAVGGMNILPDRNCLLFALSKEGTIFRRAGIQGNNPGGDYWHRIPGIECEEGTEDVSKISCSTSQGTLLALTWDGHCQDGTTWCPLLTPQNLPLAFVSIGTKIVWAVTLWIKRLESSAHDESTFSKSKYSEAGGEVYGLSLNADDQVAGTSDSGVVYIRDGVSSSEPSGKSFVPIVERVGFSGQKWATVSNSGARYTNIPKHWVNEHVVVDSIARFREAGWRKKILKDLCEVNEACWEAFRSTGNDLEELIEQQQEPGSWNRKYAASLRRAGERRFQKGVAFLGAQQLMFQSNGGTMTTVLAEMTAAIRDFDFATSTYTIQLRFCGSGRNDTMEIGFSEESERDDWHELLQQVEQM